MNTATRSLVRRMASVLKGHSPEDIAEAVAVLNKCSSSSDLRKYLATEGKPPRPKKKPSSNGKKTKPIDQVTSRAVLSLKKTDPAKYQVLHKFDRLLRQGKVLETNGAIRWFGERISKDFPSKPARKDSISALVSLLASRPQEDVERFVQIAYETPPENNTDGYLNLAHFLITGKRRVKGANLHTSPKR